MYRESATLRYVFIGLYTVVAIAATYYIQVRPKQLGQPIGLEENVANGVLSYPNDVIPAQPIRQRYIGIEGVDLVFRQLVTAVIAGVGQLEERVWLQQFHFIVGFSPMLGIFLIESCRKCWQNSLAIKYTWTWGLLYRLFTGAVIQPWYLILFTIGTASLSKSKSYLAADQSLDLYAASATLPAMGLGYVVPTLLMYLWPFEDINTLMGLIVLWTFTPVLLDPLMVFLKELVQLPENNSAKTRRPDAALLYPLYLNLAGVAAASHLYSLYLIVSSTAPLAFARSAFIPSVSDALSSTAAGLHNISLWDEIFCSLIMVLWALQAIYELNVAGLTTLNPMLATFLISLLTIILGPGATISLVWLWRERKLVKAADRDLKKE